MTTTHLGGASSDESRLPRGEKNERRIRARYLTQRKLYGRWAEIWVWTLDVTMEKLGAIYDRFRRRFRKPSQYELSDNGTNSEPGSSVDDALNQTFASLLCAWVFIE